MRSYVQTLYSPNAPLTVYSYPLYSNYSINLYIHGTFCLIMDSQKDSAQKPDVFSYVGGFEEYLKCLNESIRGALKKSTVEEIIIINEYFKGEHWYSSLGEGGLFIFLCKEVPVTKQMIERLEMQLQVAPRMSIPVNIPAEERHYWEKRMGSLAQQPFIRNAEDLVRLEMIDQYTNALDNHIAGMQTDGKVK